MIKCPNCNIALRPSSDSKAMLQCPMCPFNLNPNERVLENMYAWVSVDKNGFEGIIAALTPAGHVMTLVSSDLEMISKFKSLAHQAVANVGLKAHIAKFKRTGTVHV